MKPILKLAYIYFKYRYEQVTLAKIAGIILMVFATPAMALPEMDKHEVPVPDPMRVCKVDDDCTSVETLCSSCCGYVGINKKFEKVFYDRNYANSCSGYKGPVCDCISNFTVPVCRKGVCELIEDSPRILND